jgi:hypothetical protein
MKAVLFFSFSTFIAFELLLLLPARPCKERKKQGHGIDRWLCVYRTMGNYP